MGSGTRLRPPARSATATIQWLLLPQKVPFSLFTARARARLSAHSSPTEIKKQFHNRVKASHPDSPTGDARRFREEVSEFHFLYRQAILQQLKSRRWGGGPTQRETHYGSFPTLLQGIKIKAKPSSNRKLRAMARQSRHSFKKKHFTDTPLVAWQNAVTLSSGSSQTEEVPDQCSQLALEVQKALRGRVGAVHFAVQGENEAEQCRLLDMLSISMQRVIPMVREANNDWLRQSPQAHLNLQIHPGRIFLLGNLVATAALTEADFSLMRAETNFPDLTFLDVTTSEAEMASELGLAERRSVLQLLSLYELALDSLGAGAYDGWCTSADLELNILQRVEEEPPEPPSKPRVKADWTPRFSKPKEGGEEKGPEDEQKDRASFDRERVRKFANRWVRHLSEQREKELQFSHDPTSARLMEDVINRLPFIFPELRPVGGYESHRETQEIQDKLCTRLLDCCDLLTEAYLEHLVWQKGREGPDGPITEVGCRLHLAPNEPTDTFDTTHFWQLNEDQLAPESDYEFRGRLLWREEWIFTEEEVFSDELFQERLAACLAESRRYREVLRRVQHDCPFVSLAFPRDSPLYTPSRWMFFLNRLVGSAPFAELSKLDVQVRMGDHFSLKEGGGVLLPWNYRDLSGSPSNISHPSLPSSPVEHEKPAPLY